MLQFDELSFATRFVSVLISMVVATLCSFAEVMYHYTMRMHARAQQGLPQLPSRAPWWSLPIVVGSIVAASAGAAAPVR